MMATKAEVLRLLRFRDALTRRDVELILDYTDQEVGSVVPAFTPVMAAVRNSGTFSVPTGVLTNIQWQSVDADDDNFVDLIADDEIIMTVPPAYNGRRALLHFSGYWSNAAVTGTIREVEWTVTPFKNVEVKATLVPAALNQFFTVAYGPIALLTGDVFRVRAFHDAGANRTVGRAYATVTII